MIATSITETPSESKLLISCQASFSPRRNVLPKTGITAAAIAPSMSTFNKKSGKRKAA